MSIRKELSKRGFKRVYDTKDFKSDELITYVVLQGNNTLQIGSGKGNRLKTLMGNKGTHNKAPIVGLCFRLFAEPLEFYLGSYKSAGTKNSLEEREIQAMYPETSVDGKVGYSEVMRYLRDKLSINEDSTEGLLLDLMETHGDILQHALNTASTGQITQDLFNGYWKKKKSL